MKGDKVSLNVAVKALNDFVVRTPNLSKFTFIDKQGDLFLGYNLEPKVGINWSSSKQMIVVKTLGFGTSVKDKKTGENKDSVL